MSSSDFRIDACHFQFAALDRGAANTLAALKNPLKHKPSRISVTRITVQENRSVGAARLKLGGSSVGTVCPLCRLWKFMAGGRILRVSQRRSANGRDAMYAAIRQFKAKPGSADALAEKIKEAISLISDVSGFMGYYVVYAPDDTVTAISVFNTVAEAQESNRRALAFIEDNLGPLVIGHASATSGPVIVHSLP
jgi:quinol monooxygenase YgiN